MAFEELKAKQRITWGAGPFERIEPNLGEMHRAFISRLEEYEAEGGSIDQSRPFLLAVGARRRDG